LRIKKKLIEDNELQESINFEELGKVSERDLMIKDKL